MFEFEIPTEDKNRITVSRTEHAVNLILCRTIAHSGLVKTLVRFATQLDTKRAPAGSGGTNTPTEAATFTTADRSG